MDASALAQRVARVRRAVERAASETASEARWECLQIEASFARYSGWRAAPMLVSTPRRITRNFTWV
jgi:hypothetical protein